jgi:beta-galactosidase
MLSFDPTAPVGMYVVDEANIETHGMKPYIGRLADDRVWADSFMTRLTRMYERDKVHPCIIAWSLGTHACTHACIHNLVKVLKLFGPPLTTHVR